MSDRWTRIRLGIGAVFMVLVLLGLGVRLAFLHLGAHREVSRRWTTELIARRGTIYDCHGRENALAVTMPGKLVFLDPETVKAEQDPVAIADFIAGTLDLDTDVVLHGLTLNNARYVPLSTCLDDAVIERLSTNTISGVHWSEKTVRRYALDRTMCHVLGFVNTIGVGSAGVEQRYNQYLKGSPGLLESKVDAFREELYWERDRMVPAIQGADVHLTLDQSIQYIAEKAIDDVMEKFQATGACAVVQKVSTGEILAMVSRPCFNPNSYRHSSRDLWRNRAIQDVYEPGSTMKALVVAAALNERLVTPTTLINCEKGVWYYAGRPLNDHVSGMVTVADVIKRSSNIGAAKISLMLGNPHLDAYLRAFGLGERLNIDLPGEESGILMRYPQWSKIKPTRLAIGQGVAVTAVQMLGIYCTIANDGYMMRPYVVSRVVSHNGDTLEAYEPQLLARPIRRDVARTMHELLARVTEDGGTGRRARVPGYSVAGKTGTAQMAIRGGYSSTDYVASFVGFLPATAPEVGIIVTVERPKPLHQGGQVAAPVFSAIASATMRYLSIPPDRDADAVPSTMVAWMPSGGAR